MLNDKQNALYEEKGPQWWSVWRGFCGHCGEPTLEEVCCPECIESGHNPDYAPDSNSCGPCDENRATEELGGKPSSPLALMLDLDRAEGEALDVLERYTYKAVCDEPTPMEVGRILSVLSRVGKEAKAASAMLEVYNDNLVSCRCLNVTLGDDPVQHRKTCPLSLLHGAKGTPKIPESSEAPQTKGIDWILVKEFLSPNEITDILFARFKDDPEVRHFADNGPEGFHHGLGTSVRNEFFLWHPNNPHTMKDYDPLMKDGVDCSPRHPDNLSNSILVALHARLKNYLEDINPPQRSGPEQGG